MICSVLFDQDLLELEFLETLIAPDPRSISLSEPISPVKSKLELLIIYSLQLLSDVSTRGSDLRI
jgi:hypothetical protein